MYFIQQLDYYNGFGCMHSYFNFIKLLHTYYNYYNHLNHKNMKLAPGSCTMTVGRQIGPSNSDQFKDIVPPDGRLGADYLNLDSMDGSFVPGSLVVANL